jgi:hypothetical protein
MGDIKIEQAKLPDPSELYNQGKQDLSNMGELKIGSGSSVFYTDKEGSRWGHIKFENAAAWIKIDGTAQFKTSDGDILLSTNAVDGNFINVINSALNTSSKTILQDFTFQSTDYAGAFKSGNPTWDENTGLITGGSGVLINARGILGASNGVSTFTLDATTGNATFSGTLTAASGTLGEITIGSNAWHVDSSGNMWWGNYSSYSSASIKISSSGVVNFSGGTFTGTVKAIGTTASSDVWVDGSTGSLRFFYNNTEIGYLYANTSAQVLLHSGNDMFLSADDTISIDSGSSFDVFADSIIRMHYNYNGGVDSFYIYSNGSQMLQLDNSGNLFVSGQIGGSSLSGGDIQCGDQFRSSDGTAGGNYTSYGFITSIRANGGNLEAKYREITVKDGLVTNIAAESSWQNMGAY